MLFSCPLVIHDHAVPSWTRTDGQKRDEISEEENKNDSAWRLVQQGYRQIIQIVHWMGLFCDLEAALRACWLCRVILRR